MTSTKLMGETKQAAKEEKERIERAKKEHDKVSEYVFLKLFSGFCFLFII